MENIPEKEVVTGRPSHKKSNSSIPQQYLNKALPQSLMPHTKPLNVQVNPKSSRLEIDVSDEQPENSKSSRAQKSVSVYNQSSKNKLQPAQEL